MGYIQRDLETVIYRHLASRGNEILLVGGARQTGKSTMVANMALPLERLIINLWDEEREVQALRAARTLSEFERYLHALFGFRPDRKRILILDEAQASHHLSSFLMEMHRKWDGQKIILLGSLLSNLFGMGRPMPVGRTVEITCRPLSFNEFLRFRKKEAHLSLMPDPQRDQRVTPEAHELLMGEYEHFLQIGGLPGLVSADLDARDVRLLFTSLLSNFYRDGDRFAGPEPGVRQGRTPQYGSVLETVLKSIACHTGQPTQNSTLLSTDSPAYRTVLPRVLEALKSWHVTYTLDFRTDQLTTKKGYSSKKYLFDVGITNYLANRLLPVRLGDGSEIGAKLLENAVLQDTIAHAGSVHDVTCYRSSNRAPGELDFVASVGDGTVPLEVKSSRKVNRHSLSQLFHFMQRTGVDDGYVVFCGEPVTEELDNKRVHYLPPYMVGSVLRESARPEAGKSG